MSRHHSHIASTIKIIENYQGEEPFGYAIKKYFAANKKYGSKDRKTISSLCYNYFRTANLLKEKAMEDKVLLSLFLCTAVDSPLLAFYYPELNELITTTVDEKMAKLHLDEAAIFPLIHELGEPIDTLKFSRSFLHQPNLFLRIRPRKKQTVETKLTAAGIAFELVDEDCLVLKTAVKLDEIVAINKEVVVQDRSSQKVLNFITEKPELSLGDAKITAWDCCAASGGKSILLFDKLKGNVQLTVSDIRRNILHNCQQRLQQARVDMYKSFIADLTQKSIPNFNDHFPIIICDAPCTGSGTWSRTPEQLFYFKPEQINEYVSKQQKIALTALEHLQKDGIFFYITCSVFKKENEAVVEFLQQKAGVKVLAENYIKGYENQADTMFVAVLSK